MVRIFFLGKGWQHRPPPSFAPSTPRGTVRTVRAFYKGITRRQPTTTTTTTATPPAVRPHKFPSQLSPPPGVDGLRLAPEVHAVRGLLLRHLVRIRDDEAAHGDARGPRRADRAAGGGQDAHRVVCMQPRCKSTMIGPQFFRKKKSFFPSRSAGQVRPSGWLWGKTS
jgi:hypothetical protein